MSAIASEDATPLWKLSLASFFLILIPEVFALVVFSSMGSAAFLAEFAADSNQDSLGNVAAGSCGLLLAIAFVMDVHRRPPLVQGIFGMILAIAFIATSCLKYMAYPWLCSLLCFGVSIILVAMLRMGYYKTEEVPGRRFFESVAFSFMELKMF